MVKEINLSKLGKELYIINRSVTSLVDRNDAATEWNTQCSEVEKDDYNSTAKRFYRYLTNK
jgi:hypothetical protein